MEILICISKLNCESCTVRYQCHTELHAKVKKLRLDTRFDGIYEKRELEFDTDDLEDCEMVFGDYYQIKIVGDNGIIYNCNNFMLHKLEQL
jgi:hypothetical protein